MKTMAPSQVLLLNSLMLASVVFSVQKNGLQERSSFLSAIVGDSIRLHCASENDDKIGAKLYWYKQRLGEKPVLISSFFRYDLKSELYEEFSRTKRFKLDNKNGKNDLTINDTAISDSAVYHCVRCFLHQTEFLESITVIVKRRNVEAKVQQSPNEDTEEGRPLTLKCSVHTGSCGGRHTVHWFKQSEESAPGVLYSHGGGDSDQCGRNTDSPTNSCVYSLPIHNVSSEQTGSYYCAVAACGQVLFGNGTRVEIKDQGKLQTYILIGAVAFSSALALVLASSLCRMRKKYRSLLTELKCHSRSATVEAEATAFSHFCPDVNQEEGSLNYAALSIHPASRRQRITEPTDCVYSSVQD